MPYIRTKALGRRHRRLVYFPPSVPNWTEPGGIVWLGLAIWLLVHLGIYAVTSGFVPARHFGVAYELADHRLRSIDIRRILGGSPVRDSHGRVLIDPDTDRIEIVVIDSSGQAEAKFTTIPDQPARRSIVVVVPSPIASYEHVISAVDAVLSEESRAATTIWLAAPQ